MILYHASPVANRQGIEEGGLQTKFARSKRKRIWLHAYDRRRWAIKHVSERHGVTEWLIDVYAVKVGSGDVRKWRTGLYYVEVDIPAVDVRPDGGAIIDRNGRG